MNARSITFRKSLLENLPSEILFVSHKYPPSIGGMQRQSYELISEVSKKATTHTIVFRDNYPRLIFLLLAIPRIWIKLLFNSKIGLIHANDGLMAIFLTPFLLKKNTKLVATIHGLDIVFSFRLYQFWVRKFLSKFDLIITVSEGTKEECLKRSIPEERIAFIPNGFEISKKKEKTGKAFKTFKKSTDNSFILLSVGRPVPRKGFSWFVKNVLPLIEHKCNYVLVGPQLTNEKGISFFERYLPQWLFMKYCILNGVPMDFIELKKLSQRKHGNSTIILTGQLSDADLASLYTEADLFLMPNIHVKSDYEGFGLVTLEAVSKGVLCLASRVDGIPSAIQHEETGILLEAENPEVWAKKINDLLSSNSYKSMATRFSKNLSERNLSWQHMSNSYLTAFKEIGLK